MDQTLLFNLGLLIAGIILLVYSGNYLVKGSAAIANHFKISPLVIGLTVVAFGTSAPELIVSLDAAITGHPEIALGNVIGSNIANIALVLALTIIILPMPVAPQTIRRSWPIMMISGLMLYLVMFNNSISNVEGLILFAMLLLFIVVSIRGSKRYPQSVSIPRPDNKYSIWVYLLITLLASGGLALGSRFLVNGASHMALTLGISERIISITIVAFGTSLPELTASVIAAIKKESDISVGNIIGSNIFNVFAVIGITSGIHPIPLNFNAFKIDLHFMLAFYFLLFIFILPFNYLLRKSTDETTSFLQRYKKLSGSRISRPEGIIMFFLYVIYIVMIFKVQ